jgi:hypothetical protein
VLSRQLIGFFSVKKTKNKTNPSPLDRFPPNKQQLTPSDRSIDLLIGVPSPPSPAWQTQQEDQPQ